MQKQILWIMGIGILLLLGYFIREPIAAKVIFGVSGVTLGALYCLDLIREKIEETRMKNFINSIDWGRDMDYREPVVKYEKENIWIEQ